VAIIIRPGKPARQGDITVLQDEGAIQFDGKESRALEPLFLHPHRRTLHGFKLAVDETLSETYLNFLPQREELASRKGRALRGSGSQSAPLD